MLRWRGRKNVAFPGRGRVGKCVRTRKEAWPAQVKNRHIARTGDFMNRFRQIVAVFGLPTVMFVAAPPVPAQAAVGECPSGRRCVGDGVNGTGAR